jgi:hypothetical protein
VLGADAEISDGQDQLRTGSCCTLQRLPSGSVK